MLEDRASRLVSCCGSVNVTMKCMLEPLSWSREWNKDSDKRQGTIRRAKL